MGVDKWASQLRKKFGKINWQLINNPVLTATKRKAFEDQVADIKKELLALENSTRCDQSHTHDT